MQNDLQPFELEIGFNLIIVFDVVPLSTSFNSHPNKLTQTIASKTKALRFTKSYQKTINLSKNLLEFFSFLSGANNFSF